MYKISIICPTFNCEKFIERTIKSVQNQTLGFENIELIFVDDCSTDSTVDIIKGYTFKFKNIKLFEATTNHGTPGFGRNYGIQNSNAPYIMFIDNDDEYETDFCEVMYNEMKSGIDVVSANHKTIKEYETVKISTFNSVKEFAKIEKNKKLVELNELFYLKGTEVWSKIFKKEIIINNNIKFIETGLNEDTIFLFEYYYYSKTLLYLDYYGYKWYRDGDNLSYYTTNSTKSYIASYYELYEKLSKYYTNINWNKLFEGHIEWGIIRIAFSYENKNELIEMLGNLYEFEKYINFQGSLPHKWSTVINMFILKKHLMISSLLLIIMRKTKKINDIIKIRLKK